MENSQEGTQKGKGGLKMDQIINGKKYDTQTADLVASDRYWDGSNHERRGRNQYLYKTKKGNFFMHYTTQWQGELERLEAAVDEIEAKMHYELLPEKEMDYAEAFGVEPEEA